VLEEVIHRPAVDNLVFIDPREEFPPNRHNLITFEKEVRCRFRLTVAERAKVIFNLNLSLNQVILGRESIPKQPPSEGKSPRRNFQLPELLEPFELTLIIQLRLKNLVSRFSCELSISFSSPSPGVFQVGI